MRQLGVAHVDLAEMVVGELSVIVVEFLEAKDGRRVDLGSNITRELVVNALIRLCAWYNIFIDNYLLHGSEHVKLVQ